MWERTAPQLPEDSLQTYNDLYHCHVPKLADAGVVSYCQSEDVVSLGKNAAQLRPYMEQAAETDLTAMNIHLTSHLMLIERVETAVNADAPCNVVPVMH
jgi:hypothetical protein